MKKIILSITAISFMSLGFSQVGVETETPTETLHVQGEVRIENLPTEGQTNAIYTTPAGTRSAAKDQTFTPTQTLVADDNGVLGALPAAPIVSETTCYASTTTNFSELNGNAVVLYELGDNEFRYKVSTNPGASGQNDLQFRHHYGTTLKGLSKGANDIGASYFDITDNTWTSISTNIDWDTEEYGELLFYTDVDAPETVNTPQLFYKIIYYTQRRLSNSFPSFCFEIIQLN